MKSISIDSIKYVKATDIARELGYTADYVGQLCRAHKVDAQLVGRSWYVSEDSIRDHKQTRYRSSKKASTKAISRSLHAEDSDSKESYKVPVVVEKQKDETQYAGQHFYKRAPVVSKSNYFNDETELIPEGLTKNKTGRLSVSLADAQSVTIKSKSSGYDFSPVERQDIRFSGSLVVSEIEDTSMDTEVDSEQVLEVPGKSAGPTPVSEPAVKTVEPDQMTAKIKVKHLTKDTKRTNSKLPLEQNLTGVLGMKRARISDRKPVGGTLKVDVPVTQGVESGSGLYFVLLSVVVSAMISTFVLGLEASIHLDGAELVTSYTFDFNALLAAIYSAW